MIKIKNTDSIIANVDGITLKSGEVEITLSWEVIDQIAEISEPHYFTEVVKEIAIMNDQKKIN